MRSLILALAALLVAAGACEQPSPSVSPDALYLTIARQAIPGGAADVPDITLLLAGQAVCHAPADPPTAAEAAAVDAVYAELERFDVEAFDIVGVALALAPQVLCPSPDGSAGSADASGAPASEPPPSIEPLPSLDPQALRDELRAAIRPALLAITAPTGDPVLADATVEPIGDGVLAIGLEINAAYADSVGAAGYTSMLAMTDIVALGPSALALIFETPEWRIDLTLPAFGGGTFTVSTDADLLAELATGGVTEEDWLDRVTQP